MKVYLCEPHVIKIYFFFNDTATTEIYTLSLHDALPISAGQCAAGHARAAARNTPSAGGAGTTRHPPAGGGAGQRTRRGARDAPAPVHPVCHGPRPGAGPGPDVEPEPGRIHEIGRAHV